jgi:hypothetical protein
MIISPDSNQIKKINEKLGLDLSVEGAIGGKGWREVDFKDPGFELIIDEDVEAKQLKAVARMRGKTETLG